MYVREVEDRVLTLRVSGKLWMRSLVMNDVETGSEWSHLLGRAMSGKLKGKELEPIVSDMVSWSSWRRAHPQTTVLDMTNTAKEFTRDAVVEFPGKFVFGFEVSGKAHSIAMEELINRPLRMFTAGGHRLLVTYDDSGAAVRLFEPSVDERLLEFEQIDEGRMQDKQTASKWDLRSGEAIDGPLSGKKLKQRVVIMSYRNAWTNFHPDSVNVEFGLGIEK